jgi:hypothetical protein
MPQDTRGTIIEIPDPTEMSREVAHHLHEEHDSRLRRDLREIEHDWREVVAAFVLAFAALGSAWCAYQAASWGSRSAQTNADAATKQALALRESAYDTQLTLIDVDAFTAWLDAVTVGDKKLADRVRERFSPELAAAMETWLAGRDPDPASLPRGTPFRDGGYDVPASDSSDAYMRDALALHRQGVLDDNQADRFVLVGVVFAVTLFFGAIAGRFKVRLLRTVMVVLSAGAFIGALAVLLAEPQILPWHP